jgi:hypothetical protein
MIGKGVNLQDPVPTALAVPVGDCKICASGMRPPMAAPTPSKDHLF